MEKQELKSTLRELHTQLSNLEEADPGTLDLLNKLTDDIDEVIERATEKRDTKEAEEPEQHGLRDLLLQFETEHPQLSETLGRIADGLARMGI